MRRRNLRPLIWFYILGFTLITLLLDVWFATSFVRGLGAGHAVRGRDLITVLFFAPFNVMDALLCLWLFGHHLLPGLTAFLKAYRRPLTSGGLAAMPVWVLAIFAAMARRNISLTESALAWAAVLGAFAAGYRLGPAIERRRARDRRGAEQPPLLPRRTSSGMGSRAARSIPPGQLDDTAARLPGAVVTNRVLRVTGESRFLASPGRAARLEAVTAGLALAGAMAGALALVLLSDGAGARAEDTPWAAILGIACLGILGFVLAATALIEDGTVEFDLSGNQVTYGRRWARTTRPLSDVAAVQFLMIAPKHVRRRSGREGPNRCAFQVNLVLCDPQAPRVNVTHHSESRRAHDDAKRLAVALQVPLIDQVFSRSGDNGWARGPSGSRGCA